MVLHLDGNAFFASVMQATYPQYAGKPVVVGRERGIATAISYEARTLGITRGMRMWEIQKWYPQCIILDGDYRLFSLFSQRMFAILRTYTPLVEEYSIDEAFAETENCDVGASLQEKIMNDVGIPVSVGISVTKCLAKQASESKKPLGLVTVLPQDIHSFLTSVSVSDIWGVGHATRNLLQKYGIHTAKQFIDLPPVLVQKKFTKPLRELWQELRGEKVFMVDPAPKTTYQSIISSRTFTPSKDKLFLWAQLRNHVEIAFSRARHYRYGVKKLHIMLKTQKFSYHTAEIAFEEPQLYPLVVIQKIKDSFSHLYQKGMLYRTTGCTLTHLVTMQNMQGSLFSDYEKIYRIKNIYNALRKHNRLLTFGTTLLTKEYVHKKEFTLPTLTLAGPV